MTPPDADLPFDAAAPLPQDLPAQPWPNAAAVRARLLDRIGASRERDAPLRTVRGDASAVRQVLHVLEEPGRAGEAERAEVVNLAGGQRLFWRLDNTTLPPRSHRVLEWLVLRGTLRLDGELFGEGDFGRQPLARYGHLFEAVSDARVHVRVGRLAQPAPEDRTLQRGAEATWEGDPSGLQWRRLWSDDRELVQLVRGAAGAAVGSHRHGVDEECLVIEGDVFTGDVLIQAGDFQLAPAGSVHGEVRAETRALVYLRGDAAYEFVGAAGAA